ncbi:MAG: curli production assembly protein CsgG, partial [Desulfobacterales bacterium]|nr:curli production assembly protein CsgG [Desulfobacterales bacterium]
LEGEKIKNPQTNMPITLPGKTIAELEVQQTIGDTVENEVSLCTLSSGDLQTFQTSKDYSKLYVQPKKGAN